MRPLWRMFCRAGSCSKSVMMHWGAPPTPCNKINSILIFKPVFPIFGGRELATTSSSTTYLKSSSSSVLENRAGLGLGRGLGSMMEDNGILKSLFSSSRRSISTTTTTTRMEVSGDLEGGGENNKESDVASSIRMDDRPPRIKFKRLDKTARHIMNILDKEDVERVQAEREIADIRPGCIVQLKVEVPENKRRVSVIKGIVIARRNAGINTTFRLRRLVAGVGVESVFPLYSPNIKEMKVLDRKKVRRAKLYYLRDRMNALKK